MDTEIWTKNQEDYLKFLYSKDCMILDYVSAFNTEFGTNRSKQSLINKAGRMGINSDFIEGSRYNHIKNMLDRESRIGQEKKNHDGTSMKIVDYIDANNVLIEFQDEFHYQVWVSYGNFKKGVVKNPYWKKLYGKGYLGVGPYTPYIKKGEKTKAHDAWTRMFDRCYNETYHKKYPTYIGCEVCKEWFNFQNFAKWFDDNYYEINTESMEVDKDWLVVGNKIYSPDNCCISPNIINTCLSTHDKIKNFDMPIGVSWHKNGSYITRCSDHGKRKTIGYYHTIKEAEAAYWNYKINYVERLAEEYKTYIPSELYNAMKNFKNTYQQRYGLKAQEDQNVC